MEYDNNHNNNNIIDNNYIFFLKKSYLKAETSALHHMNKFTFNIYENLNQFFYLVIIFHNITIHLYVSVPHTVCITGINYILKYMKTETSILNNNLIFHNITVYINCQYVSTAVNPIYLSHIYIYI